MICFSVFLCLLTCWTPYKGLLVIFLVFFGVNDKVETENGVLRLSGIHRRESLINCSHTHTHTHVLSLEMIGENSTPNASPRKDEALALGVECLVHTIQAFSTTCGLLETSSSSSTFSMDSSPTLLPKGGMGGESEAIRLRTMSANLAEGVAASEEQEASTPEEPSSRREEITEEEVQEVRHSDTSMVEEVVTSVDVDVEQLRSQEEEEGTQGAESSCDLQGKSSGRETPVTREAVSLPGLLIRKSSTFMVEEESDWRTPIKTLGRTLHISTSTKEEDIQVMFPSAFGDDVSSPDIA